MLAARRYLCLYALAISALGGCEEAHEADLLDISSVGPTELDPGHPLVIEGGPFAIHHAVSVRLVGELARPFVAPEAIAEDFVAQAVSEDRIEVSLSEHTLRERFGRATFHGRVEVREDALWEGTPGAVLGRESGVVIDLVPPRAMDSSDRSLDHVLGVTWMHESERGLGVASVEPDSRAAMLGLAPGDVLVGEGDANFVPGDAPVVPLEATTLSLVVLREGEPARTVACIVGDRHEDDAARDLARLAQLAIVLVWMALLRALPLVSLDYAAPRPASALTRPSVALLARAACSLVLAFAIVRAFAAGAVPSVTLLIAAIAGLRAALRFADTRGDVRALPLAALSSLGLAAGLAALPIAQGTADLAALSRDGSPSPLEWPLFAQPVGPIALALIGVSFATTRMRTRTAAAADDLLALGIASIAVVEGTGLAPTGRAGAVALSVSVALGAWLLGHVRGRAPAWPAAIAIVALTLLGAASLGAWTFADPSTLARTTAAETVLAMSVVLAAFVAQRALTPRIAARSQFALL